MGWNDHVDWQLLDDLEEMIDARRSNARRERRDEALPRLRLRRRVASVHA